MKSLLIQRFKSMVAINVSGLAAAFAVLLVVAMQAVYDLGYDRSYKNARDIYRVEVDWGGDWSGDWGFMDNVNYQLPELWRDRVPEVRDFALVVPHWAEPTPLRTEDGATHEVFVSAVSPGFMDVFTPTVVAGDASGVFAAPGHCALSEREAFEIFGRENPIGQVLRDGERSYVVDAVFADFPRNSSLTGGMYTLAERQTSGNYNYNGYLLIAPADVDAVRAKISDSMLLRDANEGRYTVQKYALTNISDYYLTGGRSEDAPAHIGLTMYLLVIGLVILVVAVINFINLSMAMAPSRVRSVNVHRILGIGRWRLRVSLAMEAVAMAAAAVVAGGVIVHWFAGSVFTDFFTADLSLADNVPLVVLCAVFLLAVAFGVGLYTSRYATSFDVAIALKGSFALSRRGSRLRNALVAVQFTTAIFFICLATFVGLQYRYMAHFQMGFERQNIVSVPAMVDSLSRASFAQELLKNPRIAEVAASGTPGYMGTEWGNDFEGREVTVTEWPSDYNTLSFFGIDIAAGENFSPRVAGKQMIVNREFLRKYDFTPEQVIGKKFRDFTVVGVAEDVNFASLREPIGPMAFATHSLNTHSAFVKVSRDDLPATLDFIERTWRAFPSESRRDWRGSAREYDLGWLDARLAALYSRELNSSRLIGILGALAVVIAVMGVFGLILLDTRYRTREIAIRKVNGARVGEVARMFWTRMVPLVGVATVLAVPLCLVFIRRWAAQFAYRTAVPWWLFPAGGLLVLVIAVGTVGWQSFAAARKNPVESLGGE